ncbi:MAG: ribonuclease PH [Alphaproteobacteria bacterium]|nr:ribonuclease PH [Alphaproteobacteria bacterium]
MRLSGRLPDDLRPVTLEPGFSRYAEGSCLVKYGETHVLCTASIEERLPFWLRGSGKGWITAEYAMLPRATAERNKRDSRQEQSGRSKEIQRLIGRSLRSVIDLKTLGEHHIIIDCDVLQADGGTRTASITGAWIALHACIQWMKTRNILKADPILDHVVGISCGICSGSVFLDLDYKEDSTADADANFVVTGSGALVEVQVTSEKHPFSGDELSHLLRAAQKGALELVRLQSLLVS